MIEPVTNKLDREIGFKLYQFRVDRSLTQAYIAHILGISFQQVQKYESGTNRVPFNAIYKLCNEFDVSPKEFMPEQALR